MKDFHRDMNSFAEEIFDGITLLKVLSWELENLVNLAMEYQFILCKEMFLPKNNDNLIHHDFYLTLLSD